MHFILAWNIRNPSPQATQMVDSMKEVLKPYSWVRPLNDFYIVQVPSQDEYNSILDKLQDIANKNSSAINFVMSPPIIGSRYNGWLPKDLWDQINERSK
jgi:hypothetical protein